MTHSTFIDLRINNAEQLKESTSEPSPNTQLYICYGKVDAWANDAVPPASNTSVTQYYDIWSNMIGGKKLVSSDMMHVIPRYDWASGTTYVAYDDTNANLVDGNTAFYVMNSDYSVYKCLANNSGTPSTVEPTSISPYIVTQTTDGYIWKYMYSVSDVEKLRFTTDTYIPVKTLSEDDGSLQYQVQSEAIEGAIHSIIVTNGGSGYSNVSNLVVTITGDGTEATATATINSVSNSVNVISMTSEGQDYTFATVTITSSDAGATGATARAIISPPGGHGSSPLYELGGKNLMIDAKLRYSEDGVLPVTNDFRQISLLKDPHQRGTSNVLIAASFLQGYTLTLAGTGDFQEDELVYQGVNVNNYDFRARVVSWDSGNNSLIVINTTGTPTTSKSLIGANSLSVRSVTGIDEGALRKHSGRILYVDHHEPIQRSSDQIEDFKIVVKF
jgi:hypothetical protein